VRNIYRLSFACRTRPYPIVDPLPAPRVAGLRASSYALERRGTDPGRLDLAPLAIPGPAYKVLQAEADIGLLLPCNVAVRQGGGDDIIVGFLNPDMMVQLTENPALHEVAEDASARLQRVREALKG
jgi:hypothetical protein